MQANIKRLIRSHLKLPAVAMLEQAKSLSGSQVSLDTMTKAPNDGKRLFGASYGIDWYQINSFN